MSIVLSRLHLADSFPNMDIRCCCQRLLSVVEGTIDPFASIWQNVLLELDSNVVAYTDMYSSAVDGTGITSSFIVRDSYCI